MADFSCYITIQNNTIYPLTRIGFGQSWGYWKSNPPETLNAGTCSAQFQLSDSTGPAGSEGWVMYALPDGTQIRMTFDDPYPSGSNKAAIRLSGIYAEKYRQSFRGKAGSGSWSQDWINPSGHPIYIEFSIDMVLPRKPTTNEQNELKGAFPGLDLSQILVTDEKKGFYNCIGWSLGVTYAWINPPSALSDFKQLYLTAMTVGGVGEKGIPWDANYNWSSLPAKSNDGKIDGYQKNGDMTHGSRYNSMYNSFNTSYGLWESKLGSNLRITHNREGLSGNSPYGDIVVSFKSMTLPELEMAKEFIHQIPRENMDSILTAENKTIMKEKLNEVDPSLEEKFNKLYKAWDDRAQEELKYSSDTRDRKKLPEFDELLKMGTDILPLVIDKLLEPDGFPALVLYDELQPAKDLVISYANNDPMMFEGEQSRAARTVKLWADSLQNSAKKE